MINLAVPDGDGGWGLRALEFPQPARVTLDAAAFTAPDTVTGAAGRSSALGRGTLSITSHASAPDHHEAEAL